VDDIAAVIFDYDGLIVDSERLEADLVIEALAEWDVTVTYEDFGHLFGTVDADDEWERLVGTWCGRSAAELESIVRPRITPLKEQQPLLPGVREVLDAVEARGLKIGLGTGNSLDVLERRLGRHGIFDRFHTVVTRAEVDRGKPAPDIFLEVARRLDVAPTACLVLEDSVHGCEAAMAAGMRVIACPSVVTAHCAYPDGIERVASLLELRL
jgi:HAD superfamily hydrolase (TIGR01509 family)